MESISLLVKIENSDRSTTAPAKMWINLKLVISIRIRTRKQYFLVKLSSRIRMQ